MRVTYADVWEFWLRHREVGGGGRFHHRAHPAVLGGPPDPGDQAARHVDAIRKQVVAAFPGKEIFLGEFGWPSAGRMREGALAVAGQPGARAARGAGARQARELPRQSDRGLRSALEAQARRHRRRPLGPLRCLRAQAPNSPGAARSPTIRTGAGRRPAASPLPRWCSPPRWRRAGGDPPPPARVWLAVAAIAAVSGTLIGWTIANVPVESLTAIDWIRSLAWAAVAFGAPIAGAAAHRRPASRVPSFAEHARAPRRACRAIRSRSRSACLLIVLVGAGGAGGARPGVRSALPRFSVHGADRRGGPVCRC